MRYANMLRLVLISSILLGTEVLSAEVLVAEVAVAKVAVASVASTETTARTAQPMMNKGQVGVPLGSPFERSMCAMDGVATGGFDLVSYRHPDGPVRGTQQFSMQYNGSTYLFANQPNLDAFRANVARYLPAYAGFCAITLALGRITCPDYSNFKIEDDRLLLFEVTGFTNGRSLWDVDPEDFRKKADANFAILNHQR